MFNLNRIYKSNIFNIIRYGDGFKYICFATFLSIVITFFDIKTISLLPKLIESFENGTKNDGIFYFIIFALISGLTRVFFSYISSKINTKISSNISFKVINAIKIIDVYEIEKFGISNLSQVLSNDIQNLTNELVYPLLQIIISSILALSITVFLIIKIPIITIIVGLVYILLYYIFIKTSKNKIRLNSKKTSYLKTKFTQSASEIVISARYLKNSIKASRIIQFLKKNDKDIKNMSAENNFLSIYPKFIAETFGLLSLACIGLISLSDTNILSLLAILALSIQKIIPSLQSIFVAISAINCNSANIERINKFIQLSLIKIPIEEKLKIIDRIGEIEKIKDINSGLQKTSLLNITLEKIEINKKNIEFDIIKNNWTGIIGKSGIGKTSFLDLITGIAIPIKEKEVFMTKKGRLKIYSNKKNNFIYLSQFNYIPNCPIIEYIVNDNDKKLIQQNLNYLIYLLKESNLYFEFNLKDENNLFINLSENASSISGGQAQRLNILRTIFELKQSNNKKHNILAMDEPFKGLDLKSRNKCINLLKEVSSTSILITHSKEEADQLCDYIYKVS
tara:strand:+ start:219 stop:1916 length:1698 start_codon:yes stop_codon:yes gene_type:complete